MIQTSENGYTAKAFSNIQGNSITKRKQGVFILHKVYMPHTQESPHSSTPSGQIFLSVPKQGTQSNRLNNMSSRELTKQTCIAKAAAFNLLILWRCNQPRDLACSRTINWSN